MTISKADKEMIERKIKCPYCGAEGLREDGNRKIIWLISQKKYKCEICGARFV